MVGGGNDGAWGAEGVEGGKWDVAENAEGEDGEEDGGAEEGVEFGQSSGSARDDGAGGPSGDEEGDGEAEGDGEGVVTKGVGGLEGGEEVRGSGGAAARAVDADESARAFGEPAVFGWVGGAGDEEAGGDGDENERGERADAPSRRGVRRGGVRMA